MQPFIVRGDRTSHGGWVVAGSPFSNCDGVPIARVGDICFCPKCKGAFPIVQGDNSTIVDGAPVAYEGCKVACSATLIASQQRTLTEPSSGAAPGEGQEGQGPFGAVGSGAAAAYEEEALLEGSKRFRGRFQLVSAEDGQPIVGRAARVRSTDGQSVAAVTDENGCTEWVERGAAESLFFHLDEESPA